MTELVAGHPGQTLVVVTHGGVLDVVYRLASALDVLSAEDSYLAQARELTQMQARRFSLDVALIKALGGGYRQPA